MKFGYVTMQNRAICPKLEIIGVMQEGSSKEGSTKEGSTKEGSMQEWVMRCYSTRRPFRLYFLFLIFPHKTSLPSSKVGENQV